MSLKGDTNRKWTSSDIYRAAFDRIFGGSDPEITKEGEPGICEYYDILTGACRDRDTACTLQCLEGGDLNGH